MMVSAAVDNNRLYTWRGGNGVAGAGVVLVVAAASSPPKIYD